ncbi:hypothetical protein Cadr_000003538 [Camelus dromedarius]|uniref:Uncharacterized protein n=1 Tax=Camelus dromedarius TaxID=9838 RepID=A0A5N4C2D2_CAMDR|nr:hypothetical protein Cadr_000003538 [Camelus dromedarius]
MPAHCPLPVAGLLEESLTSIIPRRHSKHAAESHAQVVICGKT